MNILKNNFWVLVAILLLTGSQVIAQNIYKWTDELELLKRVDKLPEYRTDSYVEQFSSYDRNGVMTMDLREPILFCVKKIISLSLQKWKGQV